MKSVKSYVSLLGALLVMAPAGYGQSRSNRTPQLSSETGFINNLTRKYRSQSVAPIDLSNSGRMDQLIRAGNLYLSLNDAIALSLENNIGIELQRYQFELTDVAYQSSLAGQGGNFDPTFSINQFNFNHTVSPVTNNVGSGAVTVNETDSFNRSFQLAQTFKTGGNATFGFTTGRSTTNNQNANFVPNLSGNLSLNMTQPLLRGFGVGLNTVNITVAKNNRRAADYTFRTQINTQINQVVGAYWNLVSATRNVDVARQALELSQRLLEQNKQQIEIGTMAPIDIKQTEAQVANGEQNLITAENAVATQEITLKNLISRNGLASASIASVHIIPTSRVEVPSIEPVQPIQDLVEAAIRNRPELEQARINLENTETNLKTTRNALLPQLNVTGGVSNPASGGVLNPLPNVNAAGQIVPRSVALDRTGGFSNTLFQLFALPTVNYNLGFTFTINLRNRSQQAAYATASLNQRTQELQLQQQMNQIRADVNTAQINITNARARLNAAERGLAAQEAVVDGTQRKYQLGTSTLFEVIQQQNSLATSRQNVVTAQVAYATAKLSLDLATGNLMERYNVVFEEAKDGALSRRPDPIQDIVNQNGQAVR
jgi:outer membrane protein TolC